VLAVVHDQQERLELQIVGERVEEGPAGHLAHAQGRGHGLHDEVRIPDGLEFHQPRPVLESVDQVRGDLDG